MHLVGMDHVERRVRRVERVDVTDPELDGDPGPGGGRGGLRDHALVGVDAQGGPWRDPRGQVDRDRARPQPTSSRRMPAVRWPST